MNKLAERLSVVMQELGLEKPRDLADFCGVSEGLVSQWFSGKTKLGPKPLRAFSRTQFNLDWITEGRLPKYRAELDKSTSGFIRVVAAEEASPDVVPIQKVKLRLSAGISGFQVEPENHDGTTLLVSRTWLDRNGYLPDKLIAIRVRGESMEPTLYEDDLVIVNTADTKAIDGQVYAVNYEGEPVIKRMSRDIGRWWLTSDNSDQRKYARKSCEGSECIVVGRVVKRESERF
jgi:phage repressor protein C with HTH and peptisase S24 domain